MHKKIKELSARRIKFLIENKIDFYKWHKTYLDWLRDELKEAEDEIMDNNSVHLEDELWDVFWDYLCLLHSLEDEWKITSVEKVFERCYKKFSGRISDEWKNRGDWGEIKNIQKQELKIEHNRLYNNDK